ncbi:serine hydrolase [Rhabdothermincola salaria]|uniref:serine hydrolase n=1 Tax=Rhabdothermincola salaria TaxID=2903142 RepID=UPI001E5E0954|nr:serine hydrolase [Rhabdothermincola salaria]MCD9623278.1 serine hydrolase [Rhabdothermincola salaria]
MSVRRPAFRVLAVGLVLAALATSCTSDDGDDGATAPDATETSVAVETNHDDQSPSVVSAVAIPDGQIDAALAQLPEIIEEMQARSGVPGVAVAVVHDDEVVFAEGYGVRSTDTDEPVDTDTVFQIASLSKPVSATAMASLVGKGEIAWDDPVVEHLPGFALSDPVTTQLVTVADLFSHRSGLPDHAGDLLEDLGYDRTAVLERLRFLPLDAFRDSYAYTNFGLTAAAEAAAAAVGTEWADIVQQEVFDPLGMSSSSDRFADYEARENKAATHVEVDGEWQPLYVRQPDAQSPAGGVSSSANDMAQWLRLRLAEGTYDGDQLIDPEALAATTTPQSLSGPPATPDARSGFYGLGIGVGNDWTGRVRLSHSGAFALGAATVINLLPSEDLGIVVLTNGMPVGLPEAIAATFMDLVETGEVERDWLDGYGAVMAQMFVNPSVLADEQPPAFPAPARAPEAYLGTYANDYYGPLGVVVEGEGRLVMTLGPAPESFLLTHWDGDRFAYEPTGENAVGISEVTFEMGPDGQATTARVEFLDRNGLGTFTRTS